MGQAALVQDEPPASGGSRRIGLLWAVGLSLLLALAVACWLFVGPFLGVRSIADEIATSGKVPDGAVQRLGGQQKAAHAIGLYLRVPRFLAPNGAEACYLLSHCGQHMVPVLRMALKDGDSRCREIACRLVIHIGPAGAGLATDVAVLLKDQSPIVRLQAAKALKRLLSGRDPWASVDWPDGVVWKDFYDAPGHVTGLTEPSFAPIEAGSDLAATPLSREMIAKLASALAGSLADSDRNVVEAALDTLRTLGKDAAPATPALARLLGSQDEKLRVNAAAILAAIGPEATQAVPAIEERLSDSSADVRQNAVVALGRIVSDRAALAEKLKPALADPDPKVSQTAKAALATTGPAEKTLPVQSPP